MASSLTKQFSKLFTITSNRMIGCRQLGIPNPLNSIAVANANPPGNLTSTNFNASIHTSANLNAYNKSMEPTGFLRYNKKIYPPQELNEEPRPAFICHQKSNIKYSPWKMWYIACMVRGMTVDEAVKQLSFVSKKGATSVKETILEAQKLAVEQQNVEFKSNLWIAESFATKGKVYKGVRRHARGRVGRVEYFHCHYFVRLEEGKPPADYYNKNVTPEQQLDKYLEQMRKRKIINSL